MKFQPTPEDFAAFIGIVIIMLMICTLALMYS